MHRAPIRAFGLEHQLGVRLTKPFVDACTYVVQPTQKQHEPRWTDLEATDQRRTEEVLLEDDKGPPLDERELVSLVISALVDKLAVGRFLNIAKT